MSMVVKLMLPSGVLLDQDAVKVVAEAQNGSFCLLPRHADFAAALVPGILALTTCDGNERFLAVDEGILVKRGPEVLVSTWNAVQGALGELGHAADEQFWKLGEGERKARRALERLEASLVHQIVAWEGWGRA